MYLYIVELLSKRSFPLSLARREFQTSEHTTPLGICNSESPMSASCRTSHRTYRCSRSCFAAGATTTRRARHASKGGDNGGTVRGWTTTTVDARISPMPNLRTMLETSLPPPLLGILGGEPPSLQGGEVGREGGGGSAGASGWLSRRLTLCRCRLSSSRRSAASCPLTPPPPFASCTPPLLFAS